MKNQLLGKVQTVLETLICAKKTLSIKELSDQLAMPLPTVSRLCSDLVEMGLIEKTDYHHLVPGISLIRYGELAAGVSPLLNFSGEIIREFSKKNSLNALLYGYEKGSFFKMFEYAGNHPEADAFWRTGAFQVPLVSAGKNLQKALEEIERFFPDVTVEEKLIIEREYEKLLKEKILVRSGINRQYAVTIPFNYRKIYCALSFYGHIPKESSPDKLVFESLRVVSRIRAALYRSGMIDDESE